MEQQKKGYYNCSVSGCLNSTLNSELSFFKLPVVPERRTEWLRLIQREDLIDTHCFRARVCEVHFRPNSIIINPSRKLLTRNAIPQLLLPLIQSNFANKEIQTIIETADAYVQCDYDFQTNAPSRISIDTPRKRKLVSEVQTRRHGLNITNNAQSEVDAFHKLCDKFLTPTLARVVKQRTENKTHGHGNRKAKRYCIAYGCLNCDICDLDFFSLPRDIERRQEWLTLLNREDLLSSKDLDTSHYFVCEEHFSNSSFKKELKSGSVPNKILREESQEGSPNADGLAGREIKSEVKIVFSTQETQSVSTQTQTGGSLELVQIGTQTSELWTN